MTLRRRRLQKFKFKFTCQVKCQMAPKIDNSSANAIIDEGNGRFSLRIPVGQPLIGAKLLRMSFEATKLG